MTVSPNIPVPLFQEFKDDRSGWVTRKNLSDFLWYTLLHLSCCSDMLKMGWGIHLQKLLASDGWADDEVKLHIKVLAMMAVNLALYDF